jgi:energy-coupling factor transporter ATP-binding protein EcfA2/SAM-dependent methyltransferase
VLLDYSLEEFDPVFRQQLVSFLRAYARIHAAFIFFLGNVSTLAPEMFDVVITGPAARVPGNPASLAAYAFPDAGLGRGTELAVNGLAITTEQGRRILACANLTAHAGELILVTGPNGVGKTTLGRVLAGVGSPDWRVQGKATLNGRDILSVASTERITMAFQNPDASFCCRTVQLELALGANDPNAGPRCAKSLELSHFLHWSPFDLPRSARKRLGIAIASRDFPSVVILDEPTQHSDEHSLYVIVNHVSLLLRAGVIVLVITHDTRLLNWPWHMSKVLALRELSDEESGRAAITARETLSTLLSDPARTRQQIRHEWRRIQEGWQSALLDIIEFWTGNMYAMLDEILTSAPTTGEIKYLDIGCGIGWQTSYIARRLTLTGAKVTSVGLDFQNDGLDLARSWSPSDLAISYSSIDLCDVEAVSDFIADNQSEYSVITAFFVLHDQLVISETVRLIRECAGDGCLIVVAVVNPAFVDKTQHIVGRLMREADGDYLWASMYPIPFRRGIPRLYIPYFHRSAECYLSLFKHAGIDLIKERYVGNCEGLLLVGRATEIGGLGGSANG